MRGGFPAYASYFTRYKVYNADNEGVPNGIGISIGRSVYLELAWYGGRDFLGAVRRSRRRCHPSVFA